MALKNAQQIELNECKTNSDFLIYLLQTRNSTQQELAKKLGYSYQALQQKFKKNEFRESDVAHFYQTLNFTDEELMTFIKCE